MNTQIVHENDLIVPKIEVKNRKMIGDETLFSRYPFLKEDFTENEQGVFVGSSQQSTRPFPRDLPREKWSSQVNLLVDELEAYLARRSNFDYLMREYLVPQEKEFELNPMLASYMIVYGYSRICRYLPHKWGIALDGSESNEKWLIEIMVELVTKTFPLGIHSIFVGKPVTISTI